MTRIMVAVGARGETYPVTADFRARLLERLDMRGERERVVRDLRIGRGVLDNLAVGRVTHSRYVKHLCEYFGWAAPAPLGRSRVEMRHAAADEAEATDEATPPKERIATGAEAVTTPMLMIELAARGHIVDGKVRLPVVEPEGARPRVRGDCEDGPRPCPWFACRHHLWRVDSIDRAGRFRGAPDEVRPTGPESCALDVADRGAASAAVVGAALGFTLERGRQLVHEVVPHVRALLESAGVDGPMYAEPVTRDERLPY